MRPVANAALSLGLRVLKRQDYRSIDLAQQRAKAELHAAQAESQAIRLAAREEGLAQARETLARQLLAQEQAFERRCAQMSRSLGPLLEDCLRKLLGELPAHQQLEARLRVALAELRPRGLVMVRVHPDAMAQMPLASEPSLLDGPETTHLRLMFTPDPKLGPDDMVIETPNGIVDMRLSSQLEVLRSALECAWQEPEEVLS